MPLMANLPAGMEEHNSSTVQVHLGDQNEKLHLQAQARVKERDERDSGYEDFDIFDEEPEESDMERSIPDRPRPKKSVKQPPAVPQRSDKRASKTLENVLLELMSLDGAVPAKEAEQQSIIDDPHELYLSSEEDASLSDDYDSDFLVDFEASPTEDGENSNPSSRASSRHSQEDIARVVSFTLVTKPQIIQIIIPPAAPASKRHSMNLETLTSPMSSYIPKVKAKPTPLELYPYSTHRLSIASTTSNPFTHHPNQSLASLPTRKSSMLSNLSNIMTNAKNSFLSTDPFASRPDFGNNDEDQETPITPKTPTSMAAAAWRKSLSRTMSKARQPSMPKLSLAYTKGVVTRRDSRVASELAAQETKGIEQERTRIERTIAVPASESATAMNSTSPKTPKKVRYQDITKDVVRAPPPPASPIKERTMSLSGKMAGFGLSRKKSVTGRER